MFLIWGTKHTSKKLGYVAEICPSCQAARAVDVRRLGFANHLFYLAINEGGLLGYEGECSVCSRRFGVEPTNYIEFHKNDKLPIEELIHKTNPSLNENDHEAIMSQQRFSQVKDAFIRFSKSIEDRYDGGIHWDKYSIATLISTIVVAIFVSKIISSSSWLEKINDQVISIPGIIVVLGTMLTFIVMYGEPHRFMKKNIIPSIRESLKNINPSKSEIEWCMNALKKYKYKIVRYVKVDDFI